MPLFGNRITANVLNSNQVILEQGESLNLYECLDTDMHTGKKPGERVKVTAMLLLPRSHQQLQERPEQNLPWHLKKERDLANTLISDLLFPELWSENFLLFKPLVCRT